MSICIVKQLSGPVSELGMAQPFTNAKDMVNRVDGFFVAADMAEARKKAREKNMYSLAEKLDGFRDDPKPGSTSIDVKGVRYLLLVE